MVNDAAERPRWVKVKSSNVGAVRFWKDHPDYHRAVVEVWFHTSDTTYGYAASHQTYYAVLNAGSKGSKVHQLLVPRGYLYKQAGQIA